jgi:hypothetical protein
MYLLFQLCLATSAPSFVAHPSSTRFTSSAHPAAGCSVRLARLLASVDEDSRSSQMARLVGSSHTKRYLRVSAAAFADGDARGRIEKQQLGGGGGFINAASASGSSASVAPSSETRPCGSRHGLSLKYCSECWVRRKCRALSEEGVSFEPNFFSTAGGWCTMQAEGDRKGGL